MSTTKSIHVSVMPDELIKAVNAMNGGLFFDCTLGGAGHTRLLANANKDNFVVATDRDLRAVERASQNLKDLSDKVEIHHANFSRIAEIANGRKFDGLIADLGVSTDQLKEQRGFSFNDDTPLDMRMDESQKLTVKDIVNEVSRDQLYKYLKEGGVGSEAGKVAESIIRARPVSTTRDLIAAINKGISGYLKGSDKNPLTVIFQALRIAVNNELGEIKELLSNVPKIIKEKGRVAIISFHSLEDKLVTKTFREWEQGDTTPARYVVVNRRLPLGRVITKKALLPDENEVAGNPSSRSARLRIFEFN